MSSSSGSRKHGRGEQGRSRHGSSPQRSRRGPQGERSRYRFHTNIGGRGPVERGTSQFGRREGCHGTEAPESGRASPNAGRSKRRRWEETAPAPASGTPGGGRTAREADRLTADIIRRHRRDFDELLFRVTRIVSHAAGTVGEFYAFVDRYLAANERARRRMLEANPRCGNDGTECSHASTEVPSASAASAALLAAAERDVTLDDIDPRDASSGDSSFDARLRARGLSSEICREFVNVIRLFETYTRRRREAELRKLGADRAALPIAPFADAIVTAVQHNPVTIIAADTGAGKSTQVVQFLLKAGWTRIACSQPRRISCMALCRRVSYETQQEYGNDIAWQVRFHTTKDRSTRLLFLTEGVLLRQLAADPMLSRYNVIVLDEVHERHVSVDLLLGVLKGLIARRRDLRVVLMSATINTGAFSNFFGGVPCITVPGRSFPVDVIYEPIPALEDALAAAWARAGVGAEADVAAAQSAQRDVAASSAHQALPAAKARALKRRAVEDGLPSDHYLKAAMAGKNVDDMSPQLATPVASLRRFQMTQPIRSRAKIDPSPYLRILQRVDTEIPADERGDVLIFLAGKSEITTVCSYLDAALKAIGRWIILALHAGLGVEEQDRVFAVAPTGMRKCIVATNVAETSITIDGIRVVIDSGRERAMAFDPTTSVESLQEFWVSRASAEQRKGRAGRTGPGVCYRLYSRRAFDAMQDFAPPEITRTPLESVVLQVLALNVRDRSVQGFPFLDPPPASNLAAARQTLENLGAVVALPESRETDDLRLTDIGRILASLPVDVKVGKMLVLGVVMGVVEPTLMLAAALSVRSPFSRSDRRPQLPGKVEDRRDAEVDDSSDRGEVSGRPRPGTSHGDPFLVLELFNEWLGLRRKRRPRDAINRWCTEHGIIQQRFFEMSRVAEQFRAVLRDSGLLRGRWGASVTTSGADRRTALRRRKAELLKLQGNSERRKLTTSDGAHVAPLKGAETLEEVDFMLTADLEATTDCHELSLGELSVLKMVILGGLYPNVAIAVSDAAAEARGDVAFLTNGGVRATIHPSSCVSGTRPVGKSTARRGADTSERRADAVPKMVAYVTLLETARPYLTNVVVCPSVQTALLNGRQIETDVHCQRIVVDEWVMFEFDSERTGQDVLCTAFKLRSAVARRVRSTVHLSAQRSGADERSTTVGEARAFGLPDATWPQFARTIRELAVQLYEAVASPVARSEGAFPVDVAVFVSSAIRCSQTPIRREILSALARPPAGSASSMSAADRRDASIVPPGGIELAAGLRWGTLRAPESAAAEAGAGSGAGAEDTYAEWHCPRCAAAMIVNHELRLRHEAYCSRRGAPAPTGELTGGKGD